ncbi:hypothetical protein ACC797_38160, partial [Rhizobium ruizarguesonis]
MGGEGPQAPVRLSSLLTEGQGPAKARPAGSGEIAPAVENPTLSLRKNERIDRYDDRLFWIPSAANLKGPQSSNFNIVYESVG